MTRTRPTTSRRVPGWVPATSLGLSLVAVAIASYLTVTHYSDPTALACPDTGIVNCTLVTTSSWSVVFGVPLAVLGLVWAVVMTGFSVPWAWRTATPWVDGARLVVSGAGAVMVLYLVSVGAVRDRRHLPLVHGHASHCRLPVRCCPGRSGGLVSSGSGPS